jgi:hypothetical protein
MDRATSAMGRRAYRQHHFRSQEIRRKALGNDAGDDGRVLDVQAVHDRQRVLLSVGTTWRALLAMIKEKEKHLLPWYPEKLDWYDYWLNVHFRECRNGCCRRSKKS